MRVLTSNQTLPRSSALTRYGVFANPSPNHAGRGSKPFKTGF
jgi:hypothetical protein